MRYLKIILIALFIVLIIRLILVPILFFLFGTDGFLGLDVISNILGVYNRFADAGLVGLLLLASAYIIIKKIIKKKITVNVSRWGI